MFSKILKSSFSILTIVGLLFISNPVKAQLGDIDAFFSASTSDVEKLTQAYLEPLATGLSTGLNSGWTSKAAPTKTLGFSLQFRTAVAAVPSGAQSFDANDLGLEGIADVQYDISQGSSSTISGENSNGQTLSILGEDIVNLPVGSGFHYVPLPMIQGNVGLIKDTDVTVRYIPETNLADYGDVSLIGVGIKHGLNQWLPGGKLLPVDISLLAAFTTVDLSANITGGTVETTTEAFVVNALVGKTLPFLSAYAGVGYQTGSFDLSMESTSLSAPISYTQDSDASAHLLGGVQFKIAVFRIYAEATLAEYATYNAGIGIGLRN